MMPKVVSLEGDVPAWVPGKCDTDGHGHEIFYLKNVAQCAFTHFFCSGEPQRHNVVPGIHSLGREDSQTVAAARSPAHHGLGAARPPFFFSKKKKQEQMRTR